MLGTGLLKKLLRGNFLGPITAELPRTSKLISRRPARVCALGGPGGMDAVPFFLMRCFCLASNLISAAVR